jgi:CelD/BcsL family acetyltransferase involved in cellulose biosynthesis
MRIRLLSGFDDPLLTPERWAALLRRGDTNVVFLTWHWQSAWWSTFGRGQLLLIAVEREGEIRALAPFFADAGMIFFVGSGGSDYLDFIGDVSEPRVLDQLLTTARESVEEFLGFRFYLVPDSSRTGPLLEAAAGRLGYTFFDEGELMAPAYAAASDPSGAWSISEKKSLLRHEKFFRRDGPLEVIHLEEGQDIRQHLPEFFEQHVARWQSTSSPSLFLDDDKRTFYERLTEVAGSAGWLRFTRINWHNKPVAFHFGSCYAGRYLWYKPSFDIELAQRSPGEVLLRQLLLAARDEGVDLFDFGIGDEGFKRRFANKSTMVRTYGLYPAPHERNAPEL